MWHIIRKMASSLLSCSLFMVPILSMTYWSATHGFTIGELEGDPSSVGHEHDHRWESKEVNGYGTLLPHHIKRRIIVKLRKLINNVRIINRSLKDEISMLQVGAKKPTKHGDSGPDGGSGHNVRSSFDILSGKQKRLEKLSTNTPRTADGKPSGPPTIPPRRTSSERSSRSVRNTTYKQTSSPSTTPSHSHEVPVATSSNHLSECSALKSETECARDSSCNWCYLSDICIHRNKSSSIRCNPGINYTREISGNKSVNKCLHHDRCRPCIGVSSCVWCQSAETCLVYSSFDVLALDCPNNKWYWKSCPYEPTILLIMLPVLVTLSLLILIAICIKYYRAHKKKFYYKEDQGLSNQLFRWKGKTRIYAAGPGEHEEFLADKVRKKYHIVDHRKKQRPESFGPSGKEITWKKPEKLSPNISEDGRRRAASYSPSLGDQFKRTRENYGF